MLWQVKSSLTFKKSVCFAVLHLAVFERRDHPEWPINLIATC